MYIYVYISGQPEGKRLTTQPFSLPPTTTIPHPVTFHAHARISLIYLCLTASLSHRSFMSHSVVDPSSTTSTTTIGK